MSRLLSVPFLLLLATACGSTPYVDDGELWQDTGVDAWEDTAADAGWQDSDTQSQDTGTDALDTDNDPDTDTDDTGAGAGTGTGSSGLGTPSGGSGGAVGDGSTTVSGRSWTWYAPACAVNSGIAKPVLFTMHGSGGTGADMVDSWKPTADAHCFIVYGLDSETGTSWNFASDVSAFNSMLTHASTSYNIDLDRLFLHGYSAGAHWTHNMALQNSTVIAGYAVYAGSMQTAEVSGAWPSPGRAIPVHIAHGDADTVVPYAHATYAKGEFDAQGWDSELWTASAGHEYRADAQDAAWTFLMGNAP